MEQPDGSPGNTVARTQGFKNTSGRPHLGRSAHEIPSPFWFQNESVPSFLTKLVNLNVG